MVMRRLGSSDSRDLAKITEYAFWTDIEEAQEMQNKPVEAAWPDEKARRIYMRKGDRFFVTHSDENYQGQPGLGKNT